MSLVIFSCVTSKGATSKLSITNSLYKNNTQGIFAVYFDLKGWTCVIDVRRTHYGLMAPYLFARNLFPIFAFWTCKTFISLILYFLFHSISFLQKLYSHDAASGVRWGNLSCFIMLHMSHNHHTIQCHMSQVHTQTCKS